MSEENHPDKHDAQEHDKNPESVEPAPSYDPKLEQKDGSFRFVKSLEEAAENRRRWKQARDERIRRRKEKKQALENQENNEE